MDSFYLMLYSNIISIMESYLSDAFLSIVESREDLLEKALQNISDLANRNIKQSELFQKYKSIKYDVIEYILNKMVFHNINRVQNYYEKILGIRITTDLSRITNVVLVRHDIVHRNGKTIEGQKDIVDRTMVVELIRDVKNFITGINSKLVKNYFSFLSE